MTPDGAILGLSAIYSVPQEHLKRGNLCDSHLAIMYVDGELLYHIFAAKQQAISFNIHVLHTYIQTFITRLSI